MSSIVSGAQTSQVPGLEWLQRPLIIMGHVFDTWNLPDDVRSIVRLKRELGFNAEHWLGALFEAGPSDGKTFLFRTRAGPSPAEAGTSARVGGWVRDDLAEYLPVAHEAGLRVFVYFNAHWYGKDFPEEMFIRTADGEKMEAYGHGWLTCPGGPFLRWSEQIARDLAEYDIDGVFIDGPAMGICYCPACRQGFQDAYGMRLVEDLSKVALELRLKVQEYTYHRRLRYVGALRRAVRHRKENVAVYYNGDILGRPMRPGRMGAEVSDLAGAEGGFLGYEPLRGQFRYKTGATAKMLEAIAPTKPRVVFIDHAFKRYDYYGLTPSEIRLMYAGTLSNGAWPWFLVYWSSAGGPAARAGAEMNRFIEANASVLAATCSLANVALMNSDATLEASRLRETPSADDVHARGDSHAPEPSADHHAEFLGFYEALSRSQIPFDLVYDDILAGEIPERYKLLILPNCTAMSEGAANSVRRFVERGGRVLATHDSSMLDEFGRRRERPALADVFGLTALGPVYGPTKLDYLSVDAEQALSPGLTQPCIPCPLLSRAITPSQQATVLARYYGRMPGRYVKLPEVSSEAAAVLNRFGEGLCIYVASAIGEHYHAYALPEHRRMLENAVRLLVSPPVTAEGAGEFLEVSWRRSEHGEYLLHLLNHAGGERPYERMLPLGGLRFRVELPEPVQSVRSTRAEADIPFQNDPGELRFEFDLTGEYEMIVIRVS